MAFWGYLEVGLSGAEIARFLEMARPSLNRLIKLGEKVANDRGLKLL
jgi:plasmid maintenance system antidote protein VapI